jgi:DNA-binding NarL/FixJ family response regulator
MPIRVLLATTSDVMSDAVRLAFREEPTVTLLGRAVNFRQTMQLTSELKPTVVLLDLHLPEKLDFMPAFVKSQLRSVQLLTLSVVTDAEARGLAASYGALALLDSVKLYVELVPRIVESDRRRHAAPTRGRPHDI